MIFFEVEAVVRKQLPKISTFSPKSSKLQSLIEYLRAGAENVCWFRLQTWSLCK